ncbi:T9SS type A sorting domain-containing protein [Kordia sp. YSTF-M3]|uniref:T9SS type A sorting domain-containing protein n=1 Tax=Kordia aestuariivivens TaxID=2759037 RepID=A0ABR7Q5R8_9FLAO|nr:T9SS type A sorting domain-containing protein [Kordia aestuariivivens]MBC8753914.1 T9SS type A sorting domain-containing protein [Kordia aestuariivivens]
MKTKILFFKFLLFITFWAQSQQVYYSVPGANGNSTGQIRDIIKSGSNIYLAVGGYSTTGSFPIRQAALSLDTNQASPSAQEVYIGTTGAANLSINQNTLRFNGGFSSINFYDLDLNQTLPTTPTLVSGIAVSSLQNHVFYQNDFIYGTAPQASTSNAIDLILPLQTLSLNSVLWDAEVLGNNLYYTSSDNTNLYAVDLTSATAIPQIIHTDVDEIVSIEITTNYIYYGTYQGAKIKRLNRNTNTVNTLATVPSSGNPSVDYPRSIEIIGNQVFYAAITSELYVITDNLLNTNDFDIDISSTKIYPNPVQDQLHIQTNSRPKDYTIFSVVGKEIITGKFNASLDVSQLKAGIYFIKINTENGSVTKRFIKQ